MTEIQHLNSTDSRAPQALSHITRALRLVGDHVQTVAIGAMGVAVAARFVNEIGIVEFAPVPNVTDGVAALLILAVYGAARIVEGFAYAVADRIDPDSCDGDDLRDATAAFRANGDDLWDVTAAFRANAEDITNGADYEAIRLALQASEALPALHELTVQLRSAYAQDGEVEEVSALDDTAALIRAAAESLGHRDK
ncbi:hypothetical protein OG413_46265 [Streptomyces sp. NBC_01433]|uniref:hypothetical protein n=1 Tax=Streptomyces sp. NBC_01433 TaxID=2903864 RepID=UPI00225660F2|nr:hypothetical protein [Streptomyces sp. NBC_01433]MCX4682593.1 hypothetical protein [Streptomyces sp. NBC_01433]